MNPKEYRRTSPYVKWEVRSKFRENNTLPDIWEMLGVQELPAADPVVEEALLDFLKPKPIIRKVFSGWWVK